MAELTVLITQVLAGNADAFAGIVYRFQDMAVGTAYAALGDRHLAEEAAQEAFLNAYCDLAALRDPNAFPGWFRRIVIKQIDRALRRNRPATPLDEAMSLASRETPQQMVEQKELQDALAQAIATLPAAQREVVILFYMSDYSQQEICAFLGVSLSTVKMRLYHARQRLKEEILFMLQDTLYQQRPSRQETFARDVQAMIDLVRSRSDQRAADYPGIVDLQELAGLATTQTNTRLWEDTGGKVVGFAIVDPQYNSITFEISSTVNRAALGAEMLAWGAAQLGQQGATVIRTNCRDDNPERIALLQQQGFVAEAGSVLHFERSLQEALPSPLLPTGFVIRSVAGEQEVEQLVELHRAAFGTENMTVAYRLAMMRVPEYDPNMDLIIIAPDGQWAAFCMGYISQHENQVSGQLIGWLDPIGTRPAFRRQGLAQALLLTNLQRFQERGLTLAGTTTASNNVAMQRTAESVGFRVTATTSWYQKRL